MPGGLRKCLSSLLSGYSLAEVSHLQVTGSASTSAWDDVDCTNSMPAYACQKPLAWVLVFVFVFFYFVFVFFFVLVHTCQNPHA